MIRSVHHTIRCHNPAIYCSLVGREATDPLAVSSKTNAARTDHPHFASVVSKLRPGAASMPKHVIIPDVVYNGPAKSPGLTAGYFGANHDPFVLGANPGTESFAVQGISLPAEMDRPRFENRQSLLNDLDRKERLVEKHHSFDSLSSSYRQAFSLLSSAKAKEAFDLGREAPGSATVTADTHRVKARSWPAGWWEPECRS